MDCGGHGSFLTSVFLTMCFTVSGMLVTPFLPGLKIQLNVASWVEREIPPTAQYLRHRASHSKHGNKSFPFLCVSACIFRLWSHQGTAYYYSIIHSLVSILTGFLLHIYKCYAHNFWCNYEHGWQLFLLVVQYFIIMLICYNLDQLPSFMIPPPL